MQTSTPLRNRIRLCTSAGVTIDKSCVEASKIDVLKQVKTCARRPNIYTAFVEKSGVLPTPAAADTIGRLLGTCVKARDGRNYPRPSLIDKHSAEQLRSRKKAYHDTVKRLANLEQALACLEAAGEPGSLAIHMKGEPQIGKALDVALAWMTRFAQEWHSREQSCC